MSVNTADAEYSRSRNTGTFFVPESAGGAKNSFPYHKHRTRHIGGTKVPPPQARISYEEQRAAAAGGASFRRARRKKKASVQWAGVFEVHFSNYVGKTTEFVTATRRTTRNRVFLRFGFHFTLFFQRNWNPRRRCADGWVLPRVQHTKTGVRPRAAAAGGASFRRARFAFFPRIPLF